MMVQGQHAQDAKCLLYWDFIACNESNAIDHANVCFTQDLCVKA